MELFAGRYADWPLPTLQVCVDGICETLALHVSSRDTFLRLHLVENLTFQTESSAISHRGGGLKFATSFICSITPEIALAQL
jgi:hypothetical protein